MEPCDRKITLNFALSKQTIVEAEKLAKVFLPEKFLIKITPVNPTYNAVKNRIQSDVGVSTALPIKHKRFLDELKNFGFEVILSVGELEENKIGSNCGQYIMKHVSSPEKIEYAYTYVQSCFE